MRFRVVQTDQAKEDILRNADWWATHHSKSQADAWIDAIDERISSLSSMPDRFALAPEDNLFPYDIRQILVGLGSRAGYRAIYTIVKDHVVVLTVRAAEQAALQTDDLPESVD